MSYISKEVANYGTELQFLQEFIAAITAVDGISCITNDLEAQFSNTNNTPSFVLDINGMDTLTFMRRLKLSSQNDDYLIFSTNYSKNSIFTLSYGGVASYNEITTRRWKFIAIGKNHAFYIVLGNHNDSDFSPFSNVGYKLMITGNGIKSGTAYTPSYTEYVINSTFNASKINSYKKTNRVNYLYSPTNSSSIEIIKNKAFVDNSETNLEFATSSLWDCSTIAPLSTLIIANKEYFSLDAHTLIET